MGNYAWQCNYCEKPYHLGPCDQPACVSNGALTLDNAPIGTRAPAIGGGYWHRVEHGWRWCTGSTFPRPGGDWTGKLIPPSEAALHPEQAKDGAAG